MAPFCVLCQRDASMSAPEHVSRYSESSYWDSRFKGEAEYEWFRGYEAFRHLVERELKPDDRVLVLGAGNSRLSEDLWRLSNIQHVESTDLSTTVVERMQADAVARGLPSTLHWSVADMRQLPYPSDTFDAVVEKGTLDCLLTVVRDPWNLPDDVKTTCRQTLQEAHRVLKPDGCFLSITFSAPHFRRRLLRDGHFTWRVEHASFGNEWKYHFYSCRKGMKAVDDSEPDELEASRVPWTGESLNHDCMDQEDYLLQCALGDDEDETHIDAPN